MDGEDHRASGKMQWAGLDEDGPRSLRLQGTIGDHQVSADVATVGNVIHIFTKVSTCNTFCSSAHLTHTHTAINPGWQISNQHSNTCLPEGQGEDGWRRDQVA